MSGDLEAIAGQIDRRCFDLLGPEAYENSVVAGELRSAELELQAVDYPSAFSFVRGEVDGLKYLQALPWPAREELEYKLRDSILACALELSREDPAAMQELFDKMTKLYAIEVKQPEEGVLDIDRVNYLAGFTSVLQKAFVRRHVYDWLDKLPVEVV